MPLSNPYQRYQHTAAQTSGPEQLLIMSYEAILRWLGRAEAAIDGDRVEEAHKALINAQEIVRDLTWSLDHERGGDIAANLEQVYDFVKNELILANIHKDKERIAAVREMLTPLLDAWRMAVLRVQREQRQPSSPAGAATFIPRESAGA